MMVLVALLQSTKDGDSREFIRFIHHHRLESSLQGLILLEILLILVQCGGTDGTQLTTSQGRFQDVRSIHRSLTTTSTYQRVDLIDKQDDAPFGLGHFVDDALQTLLKLTLVLRTCHERTHIQRVELLVLQVLWHITTYDTSCETFHDGGLTRTRLTNQNRIILRAPGKNLQQPSDLIVTTDHWVELAFAGQVHEVLCIFLQRLIVVVSRLRLHLLSLTQFLDGFLHVLLCTARVLHDARGRGVHAEQRQQYWLYGYKLVATLLGHVLCAHEYIITIT